VLFLQTNFFVPWIFKIIPPWKFLYALSVVHYMPRRPWLVAYKAGESIFCVRSGYAALHKLLWWHWGDVLLDFLLHMSANFWIWCIFVARRYASTVYDVVMCPSVWCAVRTSSWVIEIVCIGHCTDNSKHCRQVHSLPRGLVMQLFPNDFRKDLLIIPFPFLLCLSFVHF